MATSTSNSSGSRTDKSFELGKMFACLAERGFADRVHIMNNWTLESLFWQQRAINELEKERNKPSCLNFSDMKK